MYIMYNILFSKFKWFSMHKDRESETSFYTLLFLIHIYNHIFINFTLHSNIWSTYVR